MHRKLQVSYHASSVLMMMVRFSHIFKFGVRL